MLHGCYNSKWNLLFKDSAEQRTAPCDNLASEGSDSLDDEDEEDHPDRSPAAGSRAARREGGRAKCHCAAKRTKNGNPSEMGAEIAVEDDREE